MKRNRQSIRKPGWDYTAEGWYFVTANTHKARAVFGVIVRGKMVLSALGKVVEEEWHKSEEIRQGLVLDEFVVMPDHVHGLVRLPGAVPQGRHACRPYACGPASGSLGAFVAGYKAAVTRQARRQGLWDVDADLWHRNYWDVIVPDEYALANIRQYIIQNPRNDPASARTGAPRFLGNRTLWDHPKVGFLASRGKTSSHGLLPLKTGEVLLSGFLSPLERSLFKAALAHGKPLIWVKPWGLQEGAEEPAVRRALDAGHVLLVSPFDDTLEAPSARRAAWCNQYVLSHSDRVVVGHLASGGMLACILSEAKPDVEIIYL